MRDLISRFPICPVCGQHVASSYAYETADGKIIHEDCIIDLQKDYSEELKEYGNAYCAACHKLIDYREPFFAEESFMFSKLRMKYKGRLMLYHPKCVHPADIDKYADEEVFA